MQTIQDRPRTIEQEAALRNMMMAKLKSLESQGYPQDAMKLFEHLYEILLRNVHLTEHGMKTLMTTIEGENVHLKRLTPTQRDEFYKTHHPEFHKMRKRV